ncbi:hypothetical protein [Mycobacterium sp. 1482292.6]|nr:hypothetical protein [Mycobacterium sp. 1482292.6]
MIAQHGLANQRVWEWAGGLYFGKRPPSPRIDLQLATFQSLRT